MGKIKAVVFDLDGTIYHEDKVIDGAIELINHLHINEIKTLFLTNNSSKTRFQIMEKLQKLGIVCSIEEIYTSGYAAALYVKDNKIKKPYIFGTDNLKNEFMLQGIQLYDEDSADSLIIGFDTSCDYNKVSKALRVALRTDTIISCNKERKYPGKDGKMMPGCGSMVASIEWCSDKKTTCVIGKPETRALDLLCKENNLTNEDILVVGDTFESDIVMANKYGAKAILIGETDEKNITSISSIADLLLPSMSYIFE